MASTLLTPRNILVTFLCFLFFVFFNFRNDIRIHSALRQQFSGRISYNQHAYFANATSRELQALYDEAVEGKGSFDINDFKKMGEWVSKFSVLAGSIIAGKSLNREPLVSLLRLYFPWWQPLPMTYVPWQQSLNSEIGQTGIIICAGSSNLIFAIHLVRSLREVLKSKLPIQIAYAGDSDLSFTHRVNVTDLGPNIEALNLLDYFDDEIAGLHDGGWAMKPFAMLASRFQKTIVLDADAIFLRAPDQLFDTEPSLVKTGTLFWHDRAFNPKSDEPLAWVKTLMADRQPSAMLNQSLLWREGVFHEMDSAAVCLDKSRPNVFMSLLFATWMNLKRIREEVTYRHVHGDKETFWLASELSSSPYNYNPIYAGILGVPTLRHIDPADLPTPELRSSHPLGTTKLDLHEICSAQALHFDHRGRPLWFNGSLRRDKSLIGGKLGRLRELLDKEEFDEETKTEIGEIAKDVELGKFTHWMPGATAGNWTHRPDYRVGTVTSCLVAEEEARVLEEGMRRDLERIVGLAREADGWFYGFERVNVSLGGED